jgi:hypothetical protein
MFDETEWLENRKEEKTFVHFFCIQQGQNDLKQQKIASMIQTKDEHGLII